MFLIRIAALLNNYIWILYNHYKECLIVDPGEFEPVFKCLQENNLNLKGILLTHHHIDHVDGVQELLTRFPVKVYGPKETITKGTDQVVRGGDVIELLGRKFYVIYLPGHTSGHVGFYSFPWLFCGDTVFSAGCGRLFEGTPEQMHDSLQRINKLPPGTILCSAHEYTLSNIVFAASLLPQDKLILDFLYKVKYLRKNNIATLPTNLQLERQINIFFRCHDLDLQKKLDIYPKLGNEWRVLSVLRQKKDNFK